MLEQNLCDTEFAYHLKPEIMPFDKSLCLNINFLSNLRSIHNKI